MPARTPRPSAPARRASNANHHGIHLLRSGTAVRGLVESAALGPDCLVLDLGAGPGTLTAPLARTGARVLAIERDPGFLARLERRFGDHPNVRVVAGDLTKSAAATAAVPGGRVHSVRPVDSAAAPAAAGNGERRPEQPGRRRPGGRVGLRPARQPRGTPRPGDRLVVGDVPNYGSYAASGRRRSSPHRRWTPRICGCGPAPDSPGGAFGGCCTPCWPRRSDGRTNRRAQWSPEVAGRTAARRILGDAGLDRGLRAGTVPVDRWADLARSALDLSRRR